MKKISGGVCAPAGFRANGVHCGIRKNKTKRDLSLIVSEKRASAGIPSAIGSTESGCPMTPVDATTTSDAAMPVFFSTRAHIASAISTPSALQVFALPLLQTIACA